MLKLRNDSHDRPSEQTLHTVVNIFDNVLMLLDNPGEKRSRNAICRMLKMKEKYFRLSKFVC